ncbi:MAG: putative aminopeptidase FrvX [Flammeovirgaceae bacterium]|jgi:putative aminopeptidase FrvX
MTKQLETNHILNWQKLDWQLLKQLCYIQAPSGDEGPMKQFILDYVEQHKHQWKVQPKIVHGEGFQDSIMLVFGEPRTAMFAHMDNIGFMTKYGTEIVKVGGPVAKHNYALVGEDEKGKFECEIDRHEESKHIHYKSCRKIKRGTYLNYKVDFRQSDEFVQSAYLDNRLGCWNALQVAKTLENGIIAFSTFEEHAGGAVGFMGRYIYEQHNVTQALISDITWVTDGVKHGKGVAISLKDRGVPRRSYVNKIVELAKESGIDYQIEIENSGGSDGLELQASPYPIDWCFIGAAEDNVHTPDEKVHKHDIVCMIEMYQYLMEKL